MTITGQRHEKGVWIAARGHLRSSVLALLGRALHSEEGRRICADALHGCIKTAAQISLPDAPHGYADIGERCRDHRRSRAPVFITARFRSGSTLLWNIFRHIPGYTAYYEPLNERRWFDPELRGRRVDPTHGVSDYWAEYEGLTELATHHRQSWTFERLFMDASAWDPAMLAYFRILIERAAGRPVLQCNRIDFRLPWIRRHFPDATVIHLYRHPRDEWASAGERFYLRDWVRDLRPHFPFLDERTADGYELFYLLWRLSHRFGVAYADYSLRYEDLIASPLTEIGDLMSAIGDRYVDASMLAPLVAAPPKDRWRALGSDAWFSERESRGEAVLHDFFDQTRPTPMALARVAR